MTRKEEARTLLAEFFKLRDRLEALEDRIEYADLEEMYTEELEGGWTLDNISWRLNIANRVLE